MNQIDDVFISYASQEYAEADTVRSVLLTNGISCFMAPESIPGGSEYTKAIPKAIQNCRVFVLILSDKSQNSKYVSDEVRLAFDGEKVVIPFAIENCSLHEEFNFMIGRYQRIEAYQQKSNAMEKLVKNINAVLGQSVEADAEPIQDPVNPVEDKEKSGAAVQQKKTKKPFAWSKKLPKIILITVILAACGIALYQFLFPKDYTYHVNHKFNAGTGELTIESDKRMPDFSADHLDYREWNDDKDKIVSVTFQEGLVNIGDYSFYDLSHLKSVKLPQSMTTIGSYAFSRCSNLSDIEFNGRVSQINDFAFIYCNLPNLSLPDSLVRIGAYAFAYNPKLSRVYIPESVTDIGRMAFSSCNSLQSITVSESNPMYLSDGGHLYNREKTILVQYAIGSTDEEFDVPDGVVSIAEESFANDRYLTQIRLPDSVTEIESDAFGYCTDLRQIRLSGNISVLGDGVFQGCERLTEIELPQKITELPAGTFEGCRNLKTIELPPALESIGAEAFSGCHNLETVTIPDTVKSIGEDAFFGCSDYLTIQCHNNKTVQNYAAEHGIRFEVIE